MQSIPSDTVRELILCQLMPKLIQIGVEEAQDDTDLAALLLADSSDLLDVIVYVEEQLPLEFNPEGLDIEDGLTLAQLVSAFTDKS
jgi:acyl carrier protein